MEEEFELKLNSIEISPNDCEITKPLNIKMKFKMNKTLKEATWEGQYILDMTHQRHVKHLGVTKNIQYEKDKEYEFEFAVDTIDVEGLHKILLRNMGLLVLTLSEGKEMVFKVSCVTTTEQKGEKYIRHILNPLEE
mmetsp:Transcript_10703/g.15657  ORF Transcript_10703/g.15657 Transcript_10703/m.15657 type:complete len:136 (+) Transcript_10703:45-452(+)